jgi:hypothetical protein
MTSQKLEEVDWEKIRNLTVEQRNAKFLHHCEKLAAQALADGEVTDVADFGRALWPDLKVCHQIDNQDYCTATRAVFAMMGPVWKLKANARSIPTEEQERQNQRAIDEAE